MKAKHQQTVKYLVRAVEGQEPGVPLQCGYNFWQRVLAARIAARYYGIEWLRRGIYGVWEGHPIFVSPEHEYPTPYQAGRCIMNEVEARGL